MSTRTSTTQQCLLPEMSLTESKCDPCPLALLLGILRMYMCVCATRAGAAHTISRSGVKVGTPLKDREDPLGRRWGTDSSVDDPVPTACPDSFLISRFPGLM